MSETEQLAGRGGGWVLAQVIFLAAVVLAPPDLFGLSSLPLFLRPIGITIGLVGGAVGLAGIVGLGKNLTIFPKPKPDGELVQRGVYGMMRHPIYTGLTLMAIGWSFVRGSLPTFILAILLGVFFDQKARREEQWLERQFPTYAGYKRRIRGRILPF
jgi:protein-S-isoprenylcysteine O-methyltransferase Ste14